MKCPYCNNALNIDDLIDSTNKTYFERIGLNDYYKQAEIDETISSSQDRYRVTPKGRKIRWQDPHTCNTECKECNNLKC